MVDPKRAYRVVADNRKARFNYEILDTYEAGIALTGTEVKSLRGGKATISEAYAGPSGGELFLFNAYIPEYLQANRFNHETRRPRRLLLHKRQIDKLIGATQREGFTVIPLKLYFNERGRAKVELGLGRGKKLHDKRETEKQRTWDRERARLMRERGWGRGELSRLGRRRFAAGLRVALGPRPKSRGHPRSGAQEALGIDRHAV